ncbi:hypothetical protein EXU57_22905 [Segetibacter sp. 3557_3]|uniref:hypothetical protein n=1 Tax=Segetibacter sp. 3557_3 TaxID=2547429 RepID=UPI0010589F95|nr:hypothetical protein [Segetibacter sp. 3557_3]TDH18454.1 hypothetical protein EXU57_22905 [Segetibacter sp. 3557_3]
MLQPPHGNLEPNLAKRISTQKKKLVQDFAKAADIDIQAAEKVLNFLRVDQLMDQMNTVNTMTKEKKVMEAMNIHKNHIQTFSAELQVENLTLDTLRLSIVPRGISAFSIAV